MNDINQISKRQKEFREAMANLSAAVNIITTNGSLGYCGITATAVCSVTDNPPTVIACIHRSSIANKIFKENKYLCFNILEGRHELLAQHFAGITNLSMLDRFKEGNWYEGYKQVPILKGAIANLQGCIIKVEEIGTHSVLFVEIDNINVSNYKKIESLVYFNRLFYRIKRIFPLLA